MDKEKQLQKKKKAANVFEEVVQAESCGIYPSNEMSSGILPRSSPESRAGIDGEGESKTKKSC